MYYVYIIECCDKTLYTGITTDVERRLWEHNNSQLGARYTNSRRPSKLAYVEKYSNRSLAAIEEARIKKLKRRKKIELIKIYEKRKPSFFRH